MNRIKMHISKVKLPFYPPCEVKCVLQNKLSTIAPLTQIEFGYGSGQQLRASQ